MNVLLCGDFDAGESEAWQQALAAGMPEAHWWTLAEARARPAEVQAAVVANPPPGSLQGLPALRLIQSLWAGVDRLLADATLPADVPLARMVDPAMNAAMAETALWATLALQRDFFAYAHQQRQGRWQQHAQRRADEWPVLVLGQGEMGRAVARALAAMRFPVSGWSRTAGPADPGVTRIAGEAALWQALPQARVLINLLPLTAHTAGLLDARLLAALPRGAGVVNLARGRHVVDADLLAALDSGQIGHAVLDVFHAEPLPASHPFWTHERVTLLPHVAAQTDHRSAAAVAVANLRALRDGGTIRHRVERQRGY
jgi:glyoxylate/hydroxypyruvate reductase A